MTRYMISARFYDCEKWLNLDEVLLSAFPNQPIIGCSGVYVARVEGNTAFDVCSECR